MKKVFSVLLAVALLQQSSNIIPDTYKKVFTVGEHFFISLYTETVYIDIEYPIDTYNKCRADARHLLYGKVLLHR